MEGQPGKGKQGCISLACPRTADTDGVGFPLRIPLHEGADSTVQVCLVIEKVQYGHQNSTSFVPRVFPMMLGRRIRFAI